MPATGLKVASLRRRLAAAAIDGLVLIAGPVALGLLHASRSQPGEHSPPELAWLKWLPSSPAGNRATSTTLAIAGRNWRSPGSRIVGIRAVEVDAGGPVSVHSASVKLATSIALSEFVRSFYRPALDRNLERVRALQLELTELKREHPRGLEAEHELIRRHPEARPNCLGCATPLTLIAVATYAPALWSPLN
jgi:hypothetical protein